MKNRLSRTSGSFEVNKIKNEELSLLLCRLNKFERMKSFEKICWDHEFDSALNKN